MPAKSQPLKWNTKQLADKRGDKVARKIVVLKKCRQYIQKEKLVKNKYFLFFSQ